MELDQLGEWPSLNQVVHAHIKTESPEFAIVLWLNAAEAVRKESALLFIILPAIILPFLQADK